MTADQKWLGQKWLGEDFPAELTHPVVIPRDIAPPEVQAGHHVIDLCPDLYCRVCRDTDAEPLPWVEQVWDILANAGSDDG